MLKYGSCDVSLSKQISSDAIDAAALLINNEFVTSSFFYECMVELGNTLVDQKHGKLTKRLVKLAKSKFGYTLSDKLISSIGKIFTESASGKTLHVSILSDTCFKPGIFGDSKACFFNEVGTHYRASLQAAQGQAVCFFEDGQPIGRCWLYYDEITDSHLVFNLYVSAYKALSLAQAAEAIALSFDIKNIKKCGLQWNNCYINGNQCYCLSDKYLESDCIYVDSDSVEPGDYVSCRRCGQLVPEDDGNCSFCDKQTGKVCISCSNTIRDNDLMTHEGENYCSDCYHDLFFTCEGCGYVYDREDAMYSDNGCYCESCYTDTFKYCIECQEDHYKDDCTELPNGDYVCDSCLDKHYFECSDCNDYHHIDNHNEYEDESYCDDCFDKHFRVCQDCDEVILIENAVEIEDGWLCETCCNNRNQLNLFEEVA